MKKIISLLLVAFLGLSTFAFVNADSTYNGSYTNGYNNSWNGWGWNGWNNNNNWNNWNNYGQGDSANCKTYYDGCNTCSRQYPGGPQVCTKLACFAHGTPYCKDYFNNNGGWNGNGWGNNGWNGWVWNPWRNYNWNGWGWNNWDRNHYINNGHDKDHDNDHDWDHH